MCPNNTSHNTLEGSAQKDKKKEKVNQRVSEYYRKIMGDLQFKDHVRQ